MDFSTILEKHGIDPKSTKLYRHSRHPDFGDEAKAFWEKGPDAFLSFVTYQNAAAGIFSDGVEHCAHFLAEDKWENTFVARFVGITKVTQPTRPFSEADPVEGYSRGMAKSDPSARRVATGQRWVAGFDDLSGNLVVDWGPGVRAKAQWAARNPKPVLVSDEEVANIGEETLIYEARVRKAHEHWERRSNAAQVVKSTRRLVCEGCDLDADARFGSLASRVIEVHHLTPMAHVGPDGRYARADRDFALLCATCHRLIHGLKRPDDISALRAMVQE